jgi:hypothetical protein
MKKIALILFLLIQATTVYAEDEYAVVVSKRSSIEPMQPFKLKDIFLKKRSFEKNNKLVPVNLLGEESVRKMFEQKILMMNRDELNRYWVQNHFQGVSPPVTQASLLSLKRFIEKVDGAIGYLPLEMVDDEVKVVYEF